MTIIYTLIFLYSIHVFYSLVIEDIHKIYTYNSFNTHLHSPTTPYL